MSAHLDPPDTCENECAWCGEGLNPAAFCSPDCEAESIAANEEHGADCDDLPNDHDGDLLFIASRLGVAS